MTRPRLILRLPLLFLLNYGMKNKYFARIFFLLVGLLISSCELNESSDLEFSPLFSNHMVLQQQDEVAFWGTSSPMKEVTISGSWGQKTSTTADAEGNWRLKLSTPKAGGPFEVTIETSDNSNTLKDVLVGEVWLASGQSNMEMPLEGFLPNEPIDNYKEEVASADYPQIRYFDVPRTIATSPEKELESEWKITSPQTASSFSASAYFFARKLHQELGVPIGIISSTWGGTPVESWMSKEKIVELREFERELEAISDKNTAAFKAWYAKFPMQKMPSSEEDWNNLDLGDNNLSKSEYDDSEWRKTIVPVVVENIETTSNDGAFWFRKKVVINDISSDYTLAIAEGIDDSDITYVNGQKVGGTLGWNTPRSYKIPKSILSKGENIIAIRVIDTGGGGGFAGRMSLTNDTTGEEIDIIKDWSYLQIAGIQQSKFLLFHKNKEALQNPPPGIASFSLGSGTPTVLFNGMINPLIPYTIKGAIWYQGESNVGRDDQYLNLFPGMIADWRERWNSEFPFYFVQIAPFDYGHDLSPALRDAQRKSLNTPKTGMAITMDIGLPKSIHPGNKQDVGDRLARLALANDYGKSIVSSGPLYKSYSISNNKVLLEFSFAHGLMTKGTKLSGFEIAGEDENFVPATAKIVDDKIEVSSVDVYDPEYVRYGWKDYISGSLFNSEGLPASSFTTKE